MRLKAPSGVTPARLEKCVIAALAYALFACAQSPQNLAMKALKGSGLEQCLQRAHWIEATRSGEVAFDPTYLGTGFVDFDVPMSFDSVYQVELVGPAKKLLDRPVGAFLRDYIRAGSPIDQKPDRGYGLQLLTVEELPVGRGYLRGVAKGWLTIENNLECGSDMLNGRFFIISDFSPAFPVTVR